MDVGVNTKKTYLISTACQTLQSDCANQLSSALLKEGSFGPKIKLSQKSTLEDSKA
jgi:hypothetical protein